MLLGDRTDGKECAPPSEWGPLESLRVIHRTYTQFCEEYKNRVPLEGLLQNQMLRIRPGTDRMLRITGDEPWRAGKFTIQPGRTIPSSWVQYREVGLSKWIDAPTEADRVPPEPDWKALCQPAGNPITILEMQPKENEPCLELNYTD